MPEVASDCCTAATKRYMFRRVGASNDDVRTTRESDKLPDLSVKYLTQVAAYKKGMNTQWEFRDSIPFEGNPHDAEADVKHQIKCVCAAYKLLTNN